MEFPAEEQFRKHKRQYQQDQSTLFSHLNRLIRCVVDCQLASRDAPATRHALELARSLAAKVWDNSPLQMKQIPAIGPVAVRKLVSAGINSLEALEVVDPGRVTLILSKNLAQTQKILADVDKFPKLRISVKLMSEVRTEGAHKLFTGDTQCVPRTPNLAKRPTFESKLRLAS